MQRSYILILAVVGAALSLTLAAPQKDASAAAQLQAAINKETVEADLNGAIKQYGAIAARYARTDRAVAAMALVHMAECHQKMGDAEARKIYEQVLRDYADQKEAVALAQARMGGNAAEHATGIVTRQVWSGPQVAIYAAVSPDGRSLSFADQQTGNLALHDLTTGKDRPLTNKGTWSDSSEYAEESVFAPEGKRVVYAWSNKEGRYDLRLAALEMHGAAPRVLYTNEDVIWIAPKDWSSNGKWIAVWLERKDRSAQIGLIDALDGSLRVLKSVGWGGSGKMFFSPDGQYLAFDLPSSEGSPSRDVFVLATDGSREIPAVTHPSDDVVVGWTPDGKHLLFASDRTGSKGIYALAFEDGKVFGAVRQIKSDVGQGHAIAMTKSGTLFFALTPGSRDFSTAKVDLQSGKLLEPPVPAAHQFLGTNYGPDWSPDGNFLSYESYRFRQANVMEILSPKTGQTRELRPRLRYFNLARWSPDGKCFVAEGTDFKGRQGIYRIDVETGDAEPLVLSAPGQASMIPQWTPDGKKIYYRRADLGGNAISIVERDLASGTERELLRDENVNWFSLAPDGGKLVCAVRDAAKAGTAISIVSLAGGERRVLLPASGGFTNPQWTPDGNQILLRKSGELWALAAGGGQLHKIDLGAQRVLDVRVHPDGRQVAFMTRNDTPQEVWVIENLLPALRAKK